MIDFDKIEEWNENDHGEEAYEIQAIVSKGDLLDIITRLRQSEKDAARWRFLADSPSGSLTLRIHNSRCDQRDGAIDEAMNASNN